MFHVNLQRCRISESVICLLNFSLSRQCGDHRVQGQKKDNSNPDPYKSTHWDQKIIMGNIDVLNFHLKKNTYWNSNSGSTIGLRRFPLSQHLCCCYDVPPSWSNFTSFLRWWFQTFFIFSPICGRFPIWLIIFRWVETTNRFCLHRGVRTQEGCATASCFFFAYPSNAPPSRKLPCIYQDLLN